MDMIGQEAVYQMQVRFECSQKRDDGPGIREKFVDIRHVQNTELSGISIGIEFQKTTKLIYHEYLLCAQPFTHVIANSQEEPMRSCFSHFTEAAMAQGGLVICSQTHGCQSGRAGIQTLVSLTSQSPGYFPDTTLHRNRCRNFKILL